MSLADIEAELGKLTPEELRRLALRSWAAFMERQALPGGAEECSEEDPQLLAALDEALERAGAPPSKGYSAAEVRAHLAKWTSR